MNYVCNVQPSLRIFNHRSVGSMKFVVRVEQQQRLPKIKCYIYTFGKIDPLVPGQFCGIVR